MRYIFILFWIFPLLSHAQADISNQPTKPITQKNDDIPLEIPHDIDTIKASKRPTLKKDLLSVENISDQTPPWVPSPTKAALYSMILPGLGQAYNKKYWKIPLVWGLLAGGFYAIPYNQKRYDKWHGLYINAVNGMPNENNYTIEQLIRVQAQMKRNYSYTILFTIIIYALNVLDTLVDAHLYEIDHDKNLSISSTILPPAATNQPALGITFHLKL
ncbi:MAG: DUF5683 domain-containing protein [Flavobacteriales bacterium AspAUS03]